MSLVTKVAQFFRIGRARYLVGTDLERNSYYEMPALDGSTDPRRTRRLIRYAKHKPLGEYNYEDLPIQWRMWLRHTRRSAPTLEELQADQTRLTQLAERVRALKEKDAEERLRIEARREAEHASSLQARIEPNLSQPSSLSKGADRGARATAVPTSNVADEVGPAEERPGREDASGRIIPDDDVWAASRARLRAQDAQAHEASRGEASQHAEEGDDAISSAMARRAGRRARLDEAEEKAKREKERARREMFKSPVDDFDIDWDLGAANTGRGPERAKEGPSTADVGLGKAKAWSRGEAPKQQQPAAGAEPQGWGGKPIARR